MPLSRQRSGRPKRYSALFSPEAKPKRTPLTPRQPNIPENQSKLEKFFSFPAAHRQDFHVETDEVTFINLVPNFSPKSTVQHDIIPESPLFSEIESENEKIAISSDEDSESILVLSAQMERTFQRSNDAESKADVPVREEVTRSWEATEVERLEDFRGKENVYTSEEEWKEEPFIPLNKLTHTALDYRAQLMGTAGRALEKKTVNSVNAPSQRKPTKRQASYGKKGKRPKKNSKRRRSTGELGGKSLFHKHLR